MMKLIGMLRKMDKADLG